MLILFPRQKDVPREIFYTLVHCSKHLRQPGLGQSETRSPGLSARVPHHSFSHHLPPAKKRAPRKLDQYGGAGALHNGMQQSHVVT